MPSSQRSRHVLVSVDDDGVATAFDVATGVPSELRVPSDPDETVSATRYAVEQNATAPPIIAAVSYVTTESSGLSQPPPYLKLTTFSPDGLVIDDGPLDTALTGRGEEAGWTFEPEAAASVSLVDGMLVIVTMSGEQSILAGVDIDSRATIWSHLSETDAGESDSLVAADGQVILNWQSRMQQVDPASGALGWAADEPSGWGPATATAIVASEYPPGSGMKVDRVRGLSTGAVEYDAFRTVAVDTLEGGFSLAYAYDSGGYVEGQPAFRSVDRNGQVLFELWSEAADGLEGIRVLAQYDGRVWMRSSGGLDIIDAATGERDPASVERGAVETDTDLIPVLRDETWTILRTYSELNEWWDGATLIVHPHGPPPLEDLPKNIS